MHRTSSRGRARRLYAAILLLIGALVGVMLTSVTGGGAAADVASTTVTGDRPTTTATPATTATATPVDAASLVKDLPALSFLNSLGATVDISRGAGATRAALGRLSKLGIHHVQVTPAAGTTCADPGMTALATAAKAGMKVDLAGGETTAAELPTLARCLGGAKAVSSFVATDAAATSALAAVVAHDTRLTGVPVARTVSTPTTVAAAKSSTLAPTVVTDPAATISTSTGTSSSGAADLLRTYAQDAGAGVTRTVAGTSSAGTSSAGTSAPVSSTGTAAVSSYDALHNLAMLVRDDKLPTQATGGMKLKLTGSADQLHQLLVRHSDGRLDLMLWRGAPGTTVAAKPVSLSMSAPATSVKVYEPSVATAPLATRTNVTGTPLLVGDTVQVVEITPAPAPAAKAAAPTPAPSATATTPAPAAGSTGSGSGSGGTAGSSTSVSGPWQLAVDDEFNGSSLNAAQWGSPYDSAGNAGVGLRRPSQVTVGSGLLNIKAQNSGGTWLSGGISNATGGSRTYGKWEIRGRVDRGAGVSFVALLWPQNEQWPPEVDFAEIPSADRSSVHHVDHYDSPNTADDQSTPGDYTQWHTFGVEWTPTALRYTVDGKVVASNTAHVPNTPMWLGLQLDFGQCGDWQGCPQVGTFPSQGVNMQVDWVHVYNYKP